MAYRRENDGRGYDEKRFENAVLPDLFCSICQDVLRNPRACQNKEHPFCLACISQHLENSHTCPECREPLTPETLKNPPRFLMSCLLDLRINCDYRSRGCPDDVRIENLQNHVDQCEFAPVMCAKCGRMVNRKDKDNQECKEHLTPTTLKPLIKYENEGSEMVEVSTKDKLKCHECRDIKRSQEKMKVQISRVKESQDQIKARQGQMVVELNEIKVQILAIERKNDDIQAKVIQLKASIICFIRKVIFHLT
jgi:hypothetical protein